MRIIQLDSVDLPYEFDILTHPALSAEEQKSFKLPFEHYLFEALNKTFISSESLFSLVAGVVTKETFGTDLWESGYGTRFPTEPGQLVLFDSIFVWVLWDSLEPIDASGRPKHHHELLARMSLQALHTEYELSSGIYISDEIHPEVVRHISRFLHLHCIVKGVEKRVTSHACKAANLEIERNAVMDRYRALDMFMTSVKK